VQAIPGISILYNLAIQHSNLIITPVWTPARGGRSVAPLPAAAAEGDGTVCQRLSSIAHAHAYISRRKGSKHQLAIPTADDLPSPSKDNIITKDQA
jgi:hypothetical protein